MKIKNADKMQTTPNQHGVQSHKLYDADHGVIMQLHLAPGQALKPHITPVDVVFYVVAGTPDVMIGDERQSVTAGDCIESPKDIVHCLYNDAAIDAVVLVMKLPKPTSKTLFPQTQEEK
jgi:quercetin dioxygenase-like cupin family protein